jgi:hypothetical protein
MVPPWADADPLPEDPGEQEKLGDQQSPNAPPQRYKGFRIALGKFASSGQNKDGRLALSRWASTASGGSSIAVQRAARAINSGSAALAAVSRANSGLAPETGALDLRTLSGTTVVIAINTIVDAFCPPGILDEEITRIAVGEALAEALSGEDTFDPANMPETAISVAVLAFVSELTFAQIAIDVGDSLLRASSPLLAAKREAELKSLVKEVTHMVGPAILRGAGSLLTQASVAGVVAELVRTVHSAMESWQ